MNRVLVTGANGFVGKALCAKLAEAGDRVTGIDIECDLTNATAIADFLKDRHFDYIFHLAAITTPQTANKDVARCFAVNVGGTVNLLDAVRQQRDQARIIFASTYLDGKDPYSVSKRCAEAAIDCFVKSFGMDIVTINFCNIYGPGDTSHTRIIPRLCKQMIAGEMPCITGTYREFVHISDAVRAYLCAALSGSPGHRYVLNPGFTMLETVATILLSVSNTTKLNLQPLQGKDAPVVSGIDLSIYGWKPTVTLEAGLKETFDWVKRQIAL